MDLVRELLLKLEAFPLDLGHAEVIGPEDPAIAVPGYDVTQINYHMDLIHEAGFINDGGGSQPMLGFIFCGLTWKGHEFLDDIRDPEIWSKTKERAKGIASIGLGFVWEIAKAEIKTRLGLP
jgi:hypothetical protein